MLCINVREHPCSKFYALAVSNTGLLNDLQFDFSFLDKITEKVVLNFIFSFKFWKKIQKLEDYFLPFDLIFY